MLQSCGIRAIFTGLLILAAPAWPDIFETLPGVFKKMSVNGRNAPNGVFVDKSSETFANEYFGLTVKVDFPNALPESTVNDSPALFPNTVVLKTPVKLSVKVTGSASSRLTLSIAFRGRYVSFADPPAKGCQDKSFVVQGTVDIEHSCLTDEQLYDRYGVDARQLPNGAVGLWTAIVSYDSSPRFTAQPIYDFVYRLPELTLQDVKPDPGGGVPAGKTTFSGLVNYRASRDSKVALRLFDSDGNRLATSNPIDVFPIQGSRSLELKDFEVKGSGGDLFLEAVLLDAQIGSILLKTPQVKYGVPRSSVEPRQPTDTRFVTTAGPGLKTACRPRSEGPLNIPFDVPRVVGEVDANGFLRFHNDLIENGVVSETALLRISSLGRRLQGTSVRRDRVLLNDSDILAQAQTEAVLTGPAGSWQVTTIKFPIEQLRFPSRTPGRPAQPRRNTLQIRIDDGTAAGSPDAWCSTVDWVEISINALAPVIMIHGNGQGDDGKGGMLWEGRVLNTADEPRLEMSSGVTWPFDDQRIPYDNTISMFTDNTAAHGALLSTLIPMKAAEFGSRHVHLLAHSKGGLDSRYFLVNTLPPNFGVLSLTTLSTPHQGSAGPDYQIDAVGASLTYSDDSARAFIGYMAEPNKGTESIRVSSTREFNRTNVPLLPKELTVDGETRPVAYRSFSADMNLDDSRNPFTSNPTISYNETYGLPGQGGKLDSLWAEILQSAYRITGEVIETYAETIDVPVIEGGEDVRSIKVKVVREKLSPVFRPNDIAVTRESASVGPFVEVEHLKANHSTIVSKETGEKVIQLLRLLQPMTPPGTP